MKRTIFVQRAKKALAKGQSPPQELKRRPRSGPYLQVCLMYQHHYYRMQTPISQFLILNYSQMFSQTITRPNGGLGLEDPHVQRPITQRTQGNGQEINIS